MLEIKNQQFYEYNVSLEVDEDINTLFIFDSSKYAYEYSMALAGLKKSEIYYLDKQVYQNDIYFKSRIYINNNISYINTLNPDAIENKMLKAYNKAFDKEYFKALVTKTKIRTLIRRKRSYKFKDETLALSNDIFALSTMSLRIFYLCFNKIDKDNLLTEEFKIHKSNIFISALDAIYDDKKMYKDIVDKLVIFYKGKVSCIKISDKVLKINKDSNSTNINIIKNLIYEDDNYYYVEESIIKDNNIKGIKYKDINIMDIYKEEN